MEAQWAKTERKTGRLSPSLQGEDSSGGRVCREKDTQSARRRREGERFMVAAVLVRGEEIYMTLLFIRILSLIGQQVVCIMRFGTVSL